MSVHIRIEQTNKALSSLGGLSICNRVIDLSGLEKCVHPVLSDLKSADRAWIKFKALCLGFLVGADCLADMDRLAEDIGFSSAVEHVHSANTYGDYLRTFSAYDSRRINDILINYSLRLRNAVQPKAKEFILDIDSSSHVQYGKKIEGVGYDHKNQWCLDSLQAFDQFGFQYWINVRPGGTFTSNNAPEVIHAVFSKLPKKQQKILRADSGYCNTDVFNAAHTANAKFVIAMRENMFGPLLESIRTWNKASKVKFYNKEECEIGETIYRTKKGQETLRVIVLRARKEKSPGIISLDDYEYLAWVTNYGRHEKAAEKIIGLYRKRGNAENYIREIKYGFDLKHFPCSKLNANNAYALIASFAYNIARFLSFIENPKKQHFVKKIRTRMLFLPVQVVKHGRETIFRFCKHHYEEVHLWLNRLLTYQHELCGVSVKPPLLKT